MKIISSLKPFLKDKFFSNSAWTFLIRVLGIVLQFATLLLLTNYTSDTLVGKFNYISYLIVILGAFVLLGLNTSFFQFAGKLETDNRVWYQGKLYIKTLIIISVSFSILLSLYILLINFFKINIIAENRELFNYLVIGVYPFSVMTLNFQVIRSFNKLFISEIYRSLVRFGLMLLVFVALIMLGRDEKILLAYILVFFVIAIVSTFYIIFGIKKEKIRPEHKKFQLNYRQILKISVPMSLSSVSLLLMQSIDTVILKLYETFEAVAYYGTAMKISILINVVLMVITTVIAPKISKFYFSSDWDSLKKLIQNAVNLNFILSFPVIVLSIIFSKSVLSIFGENYVLASQAFIIILLGQMVNSFCGPVGIYLNMTNKQNIFRNILGFALALNIFLNFWLIPIYGMIGAAIGMSISLALWNIMGCIIVWRKDKIILLPKFKGIV